MKKSLIALAVAGAITAPIFAQAQEGHKDSAYNVLATVEVNVYGSHKELHKQTEPQKGKVTCASLQSSTETIALHPAFYSPKILLAEKSYIPLLNYG